MLRSNVWGAILGEIHNKDLRDQIAEAIEAMDGLQAAPEAGQENGTEPERRGGPLLRLLGAIQRQGTKVNVPVVEWLKAQKITSDEAIAKALLDELLAIPAPPETQRFVEEYLKQGRKELNLFPGKLLTKPEKAQTLLMHTIHLILALPEANLG